MIYVLLSAAAGFLATYILASPAMHFLRSSGIVGIDQQKEDRPELPTSGGVPVLFGFLTAVSVYIGATTFLPGTPYPDINLVLAALSSVFVIGMIGLLDDIHVERERVMEKGAEQVRVGLAQRYKFLAPVAAALPLMAVRAGTTTMHFPFVGPVQFGAVYPLVLVPVAVTSVVNAANMLAGQNGLEASLGTVSLAGLGAFALTQGRAEGAVIALGMAASLIAFLRYNFFPADILPGDSLTYGFGAAYVSTVIVANIETFGIFVFAPWIVEAFLKLRSGFQASSLGELQPGGTLKPEHDGIYSLTHVLMRFDLTEKGLVIAAAAAEAAWVTLAFLLFL
ncbi:MAG: hypothetical protein SVQ76_00785 [Candidatus Nanohaloarchaea archaeon]|nr:hypothetical protein [Candidatus Nanohaloarchaea archaeon]